MTTLKDVAKAVGVSPSTVSRALADSPLVNRETKARILRAAMELGYERNEVARALVMGISGAVGLIVPDITNPFFSDVARGVSEIADRAGYGVILCNTDGRPDRELSYIRLLRRKRVDGLIVCSATLRASYVSDLAAAAFPYVLVSRLSLEPDAPYVITDDRAGARLAVEHLIDLGHRRIAFIGGPENVQSSRDRMASYLEVLAEHGLPDVSAWRCHTDFTQGAGREAGRRMLSLDEVPSAIFAANDVIALGVLEVAEGLGLPVPGSLSLIGYDDIRYAALPRIQLTTIAQPAVEMGQIAADGLLAAVKAGIAPTLQRVLAPRLVVRSSTAPHSE
ncbi:MAG: LacI family DNA-binding transcriptional regulator [Candidatus Bipolaricaulota bacterium]|nr:MAG: LacI family DNA-binding transcriptional regulator [Candidatus Bipolaricaulota bacterium]